MKNLTLLLVVIQLPINIIAQSDFTGTVKDDYGVLVDASIFNKNTQQGAISDAKGDFSIGAKKNDTLVISYVGYKRINLIVSDFKHCRIILEVDNVLEKVLVVAQPVKTERMVLICNGEQVKFVCKVKGIEIEGFETQVEESKNILYPNPSKTGVFNIKTGKPFRKFEIQISTLSGQLILKRSGSYLDKLINIDLSNYPEGIYIVNYIIDGERQIPKKAIIN